MSKKLHKWELVQEDQDRCVERMEVPDGWIYLVTEKGELGGILYQHTVYAHRPLPGLEEARLLTSEYGPREN